MSWLTKLYYGLCIACVITICIAIANITCYCRNVDRYSRRNCWKPHVMMIANVFIVIVSAILAVYFGYCVAKGGLVIVEEGTNVSLPAVKKMTAAVPDMTIPRNPEAINNRIWSYNEYVKRNSDQIKKLHNDAYANLRKCIEVTVPDEKVDELDQLTANVKTSMSQDATSKSNAEESTKTLALIKASLPGGRPGIETQYFDDHLNYMKTLLMANRQLVVESGALLESSQANYNKLMDRIQCQMDEKI